MAKTETLSDFYQHKLNWLPHNLQQDTGHFNVFQLDNCVASGTAPVQYSRRDFYKISFIRGNMVYHYGDRSLAVSGPTLMFFNPQVPYTWQPASTEISSSFCIFREAFVTEKMRENLHELPMFRVGGKPAYALNEQQAARIGNLFEKMLDEINSDYAHKYDLLRNYLFELIHSALKMQPSETLHQHPDAKSRLTAVFTELLERQFPIETPGQRFRLRSANDFAERLSVHVNHLNRSVRETTGKTTTEHIAGRLMGEARALLQHTDWNIAQIGHSLGFDEPTHFANFVKKQTGTTPTALRNG